MPNEVTEKRKLWDRLLAHAHKLEHAHVKVGVLSSHGASEPHGDDASFTLVEIAACHEFGTDTIPERSFIRSTFSQRVPDELVKMQAALAREVVTKGLDPEKALARLGAWGAAEVKKTITEDDIPPPLAASTIAAKGSTKPLVDTGQLKNSISYEVVGENEAMAAAARGES